MAPGIVPLKAQAEMDAIAARLKTQYPATNRNSEITVVPLQKQVVANVAASLWLLFAATGLVLVVTCVNVGNLFLARAVARRREVAIRSALGAGRSRLAGQLLTECVLLSGLSGMAALALTGASLKVLPFWLPLNFPRIDEIGLDVQVVILIAVVSLTSGLLLGLFPALSASRCEATEGLGDGGRANVSGRRESSLSRVLVASQFAAAALLLICSGLLMKSFVHLQQVEPGFKASNLLAMRVNLPLAKYTSTVRVAALYEELIRRVQNLPGVQAATVSLFLPFGNSQLGVNLDLEGGQLRTDEHKPVASYHVIGPDHFETMGIRILEGRSFQWNDNPAAARVAIVSASMAKLFWPNRNPVGKRLRLGDPDDDPTWMTIVGVAGDIRQYGLDVDPRPTLYVPALQHSETSLYLVARTKIDPERLAGIVTNEIASLDRGIAVSDVGTVLGKIQQSVQQRQLVMLLVSGFGVVALLLAAFGIYAVLTYFVSRKTQEIGIRMAVGATRANVLCQILGFGCPPAFAGIGAGLAMALMAGRILAGFLYETRFYDAPVILGASLSLLAVGLVATYIPARRAMNVDPMTALRSDR
jgi:putative ABC transport system permease protein